MAKFVKGERLVGRAKGTPNKMAATAKELLQTAYDGLGGVGAMIEWGRENQSDFYALWSKILPHEVKAAVSVTTLESLVAGLGKSADTE